MKRNGELGLETLPVVVLPIWLAEGPDTETSEGPPVCPPCGAICPGLNEKAIVVVCD